MFSLSFVFILNFTFTLILPFAFTFTLIFSTLYLAFLLLFFMSHVWEQEEEG